MVKVFGKLKKNIRVNYYTITVQKNNFLRKLVNFCRWINDLFLKGTSLYSHSHAWSFISSATNAVHPVW